LNYDGSKATKILGENQMSTKVELNETRLNDGSMQENQAQRSNVHTSPEGVPYVPGTRTVESNPQAQPASTTSPRMVYGPKGDKGDTGAGIPGPQGAPGKDADIAEVVAESKKIVSEAVAKIQGNLRSAIVSELTTRGVIDTNGNAIPGPAGKDGADSTVAGPAGKDGESIVGPAGKDGVTGPAGKNGKDGKDADITAAVAAVTAAVETKLASLVSGLDDRITAILERSNVIDADGNKVPAPAGPQGVPGVQGKPGDIAAALWNCEQYVEKELAKFRTELGLK
jgi:hypothetical protein